MNIYHKKQRWKLVLFIAAIAIVGVSLFYTNHLVKKLSTEERRKVRLWAGAIKEKAKLVKYTDDLFSKIKKEERKSGELWAKGMKNLLSVNDLNCDISFFFEVVKNNETVPVILTNEKKELISQRNVDSVWSYKKVYLDGLPTEEVYLMQEIDGKQDTLKVVPYSDELKSAIKRHNDQLIAKEIKEMGELYSPIEIELKNGKNYLYYKDSRIFAELKKTMDDLLKSFRSEIVLNSASVPVIYADSIDNKIIDFGNIDTLSNSTPQFWEKKIKEMRADNDPIRIELTRGEVKFIYYQESFLLTQLKYYPYAQFTVIGLFLLISYVLFSTARKAEQNQVWVGMAKETAHQLGTPLSSLMAWLEMVKLKTNDSSLTDEIQKDIKRLETITDRFSKIGSTPKMEDVDVFEVIQQAIKYLQPRLSNKVQFTIDVEKKILAKINVPLFEWVIENLTKNAVDAMSGVGEITFTAEQNSKYVKIDITDTGKGISKRQWKKIFEPGYTSKKRGWGLGLTLVKRIIESYHKGKISIKQSTPEKGTTFRIVLHK